MKSYSTYKLISSGYFNNDPEQFKEALNKEIRKLNIVAINSSSLVQIMSLVSLRENLISTLAFIHRSSQNEKIKNVIRQEIASLNFEDNQILERTFTTEYIFRYQSLEDLHKKILARDTNLLAAAAQAYKFSLLRRVTNFTGKIFAYFNIDYYFWNYQKHTKDDHDLHLAFLKDVNLYLKNQDKNLSLVNYNFVHKKYDSNLFFPENAFGKMLFSVATPSFDRYVEKYKWSNYYQKKRKAELLAVN